MNDMKKCSKFKTISSKCNFNEDNSNKDGLNPNSKVCSIGYYSEKREQKIEYQKFYAMQNRVRIILYEKIRKKNKFKL